MNKDNLKIVRDAMAAALPETIDMSTICSEDDYESLLRDCGTCGCIMGFTFALFDPTYNDREVIIDKAISHAADILDLSFYNAKHLFMGWWSDNNLSEITQDEVVSHLDTLLESE